MKNSSLVQNIDTGDAPMARLVPVEGAARLERGRVLGVNAVLYVAVCLAGGLLLTAPARALFAAAGLRWAYILGIAFCISFSAVPPAAWLARRLGVLDAPGGRKLHARPTPLLGGAAVFCGFLAALLANGIMAPEMLTVLSAAMVLFVAGVCDDRHEVSAGIKLVVQLVCTATVMASGVVLRVLPESLAHWALAGNWLLTLVWVVGITNAMNFFDGMDGLAAGLGAIIAFFLAAVAYQTGQPFLGWIALAVMGACLGFLPFNFRRGQPAGIFLGDAGSTVIGFVLACIAVYGDWADGRPLVSLVSPLLIFWLLIFDMLHTTVERIATGKVSSVRAWIEYAGKDHLHHRLADALGSTRGSVMFIFLMGIGLGISALMLRYVSDEVSLLLIVQAAILVVLVTVLERRGRHLPEIGRAGSERLRRTW
ncbi:MAG: undecaprenyl/decaprenyl-phosphate alpha-N-acetylglucosaminyl 1-phosphate transferase [Desulfobacterales bacterium]|jgi:UDP-GlcNAc:undecaprenyl-phosphate GlcNAc-1-phosphate transferase|nr:undecaprenyl/decaprenyl-phosphate alpha-N-acetylglucosaminyl 1-phosphate transferase [Desulfobacterales bacterium]